MASPIPPITVTPNTDIDMADSCNCCWPRRSKKRDDDRSVEVSIPVRDANEVYNFDVNIHMESKRSSDDHHSDAPEEHAKTAESIRSPDKHSTTKPRKVDEKRKD